ncbi:MAG: double-strand break repair protein AddB [Rhizobiaceae bacterium]
MGRRPNLWSIPAGLPFLPALADAIGGNRLIDGVDTGGEEIAALTVYVPTRRAARMLRGIFVERAGGRAVILPTIRPLGEFDEEADLFEAGGADIFDMPAPVDIHERILALAPLVRAWKSRLPAHIASMFEEDVVVPVSAADAIWMARDLAALIDEVETEDAGWAALAGLVPADLARWWQVTLDFLEIVTGHWPGILAEKGRSDPAAWRNARIAAEAARLERNPAAGPVVAAGSTGSIPATARLLSAIAHHPSGAVVLPGLDRELDEGSWQLIGKAEAAPSVFGHPQYGLKKLLQTIGAGRDAVAELGAAAPALAARAWLVNEALRPAETTDLWAGHADRAKAAIAAGALDRVSLIEAANEREEALAIAIALRQAVEAPGHRAALVTGDRNLARRVSAELLRFGITADDSGGRPLVATPPATLLSLITEAVFRPGDPTVLLDLLAHPLLACGLARAEVRRLAALAELVLLRGGTGRPDIRHAIADFDERLAMLTADRHPPFWLGRISEREIAGIRQLLAKLVAAVEPLCRLRGSADLALGEVVMALVGTLEAVARGGDGSLAELYEGDAGDKLAATLRSLIAAGHDMTCRADEVPDVVAALLAPEIVKPTSTGDGRVAIWGVLEARLQSVDTLVVGALNEDSWPRKVETGRFMSRVLAGGLGLEPPERRTGQAAHDFQMALGAETVILSRSQRAGDAPASPSRWLQRLLAVAGETAAKAMRARGEAYLRLATAIDEDDRAEPVPEIRQPCPTPPLEARPTRFSVTEIETLRRDPYAVYARRILRLEPVEPLCRDPGAAERGSLFHDILHRFTAEDIDPEAPDAEARLLDIAATCFDEAALPGDVRAVWWPRFAQLAPALLDWERKQSRGVRRKFTEIASSRVAVGATGVVLSGRADRIDLSDGGEFADILDFKTGDMPTRMQARTLLAPQLALEGALLARGAFAELGSLTPADLLYVRLKSDGTVRPESVPSSGKKDEWTTAEALADEAWDKLERLLAFYADPANGYRSRALPLREQDMDGDYDHLARALEWSSGGDGAEGGGE